jgi:hypothetical protein
MYSCFSVGRRRNRSQWRYGSSIAGNSFNRALSGMLRSKHPGRRRVLPSPCSQITIQQVRPLDPLTLSSPVIEKIGAYLWQVQTRPAAAGVIFVRGLCLCVSYSLRCGLKESIWSSRCCDVSGNLCNTESLINLRKGFGNFQVVGKRKILKDSLTVFTATCLIMTMRKI